MCAAGLIFSVFVVLSTWPSIFSVSCSEAVSLPPCACSALRPAFVRCSVSFCAPLWRSVNVPLASVIRFGFLCLTAAAAEGIVIVTVTVHGVASHVTVIVTVVLVLVAEPPPLGGGMTVNSSEPHVLSLGSLPGVASVLGLPL